MSTPFGWSLHFLNDIANVMIHSIMRRSSNQKMARLKWEKPCDSLAANVNEYRNANFFYVILLYNNSRPRKRWPAWMKWIYANMIEHRSKLWKECIFAFKMQEKNWLEVTHNDVTIVIIISFVSFHKYSQCTSKMNRLHNKSFGWIFFVIHLIAFGRFVANRNATRRILSYKNALIHICCIIKFLHRAALKMVHKCHSNRPRQTK